jgi:Zn-dependent peptidase ImmA (M78 family)
LDTAAFSAATLACGPTRRVILHNDGHDWRRQRSNIAHEIAHLVLKHPFTLPIDGYGCRNIDRDVEEEATWLGATILIPDAAALHIVRAALSTPAACELYGVSAPLLRMRINASGARVRLARAYH